MHGAWVSAMEVLQYSWISDHAKVSEFKLTVADIKIKVCEQQAKTFMYAY